MKDEEVIFNSGGKWPKVQ